ncbi:nitroreductase [Paenibacillus sp. NEAU-GSW1]|uniref:nitroreductase family protein n=1 Tax=Paenibacillus sp. NEAU-GSW1 TaxID=2682486 RepID=UPI0012E20787|nr:nitroreductase [Paenibacillus sp. NEAU-GSW1]MUT67212.1 nitroreductase [Paenibacillus sp. NEAU-GSW1]
MEKQKNGSIEHIIRSRRSVRLFRNEPIETSEILELLNIAVWAPNHGMREPWRFILYRDGGRQAFADAVLKTYTSEEHKKMGAGKLEYYTNIPAHLVIILKEDPRQKEWDEDYAAVCCLIQNFQLAAWERGIGVVWKTNWYSYDPKFREAAGLKPGEKIVGVLHIGYPEQVPPERPRTSAEELLTIIDR